MDDYKFRVDFLDDVKQFLTILTKRVERKSFTIFGKHEAQTTKNCLKSYKTKFGSLELNTTKLTSDFLPFGTK